MSEPLDLSEAVSGAAQENRCEHHWVSHHGPHMPIWIVQCSMCAAFD